MPIRKTFASLTSKTLAFILMGPVAIQVVPLQAQEVSWPGVRTNPGTLKLLHSAAPRYPPEALEKGIQGEVVLDLTLDAKGNVQDAHVVSGPVELRKATLQAVLQWHYQPGAGTPGSTRATVMFNPDPRMIEAQKRFGNTRTGPRLPTWAANSRTIQTVDLMMPAALKEAVQPLVRIHKGDSLTDEAWADLEAAVKGVDQHLSVGTRPVPEGLAVTIVLTDQSGMLGGIIGGIPGGILGSIPNSAPPPPPPPARTTLAEPMGGGPTAPTRIRVGGNVQQKKLIQHVVPAYPPLAKQARIQGVVRLSAIIGRDGNITSLQVLSGHPLLTPPAVEAVRQWKYETTLLNGNPVEVVSQIDVNFALDDAPPAAGTPPGRQP